MISKKMKKTHVAVLHFTCSPGHVVWRSAGNVQLCQLITLVVSSQLNVVIKNASRMHACSQYRLSEMMSVQLRIPYGELQPVRRASLPPHSSRVRLAGVTLARAPHSSCPHLVAAPQR